MRRIIFFLLTYFLILSAPAQVVFVERHELPAQSYDPNFELMKIPSGLVAFRTYQERSFSSDRVFQYFLSDQNLLASGLNEVSMKPGFDMMGYDTDEDQLYVLFTKGTSPSSEKYVLHLDLSTQVGVEYPASNLLPMDLVEFLVLDKQAIFLGISDTRPVLQILSFVDNSVHTVQGIYGNETQVIQLVKIPELEAFDVVVQRKLPLKVKETAVLTFDLQGNLIRELKLGGLGEDSQEFLDGLLLPATSFPQAMVGAFGKASRNSYEGMYLLEINEFGEVDSFFYTLEDFPNFYNYLPEKKKEKQNRYVASQLEKGKKATVRNTYAVRAVYEKEDSYVMYFDQRSETSSRGPGRVAPPYTGIPYRFDRFNRLGYVPYFMDPLFWPNASGQAYSIVTEYTYRSAHFIEVAKTGQVLWDNASSYEDFRTTYPEPFGEFAVQGEEVIHLYLLNDQLKLNLFKAGEKILENQTFPLELPEGQGSIQYTDLESLRLGHWYGPYFLLSGLQKVRFTNEDLQEEVKEVFFMSKILVDGNLIPPKEDQD